MQFNKEVGTLTIKPASTGKNNSIVNLSQALSVVQEQVIGEVNCNMDFPSIYDVDEMVASKEQTTTALTDSSQQLMMS